MHLLRLHNLAHTKLAPPTGWCESPHPTLSLASIFKTIFRCGFAFTNYVRVFFMSASIYRRRTWVDAHAK
jgi:hypothetical protein